MNNILITGGLGYIGGRVASCLKEKNPNTNIVLTTRNKNKQLPSWANHFTVLQMNLLSEDSIDKCLKDIDIIIHLASLNEIDSMADPKLALEVNTLGTYRLLNLAKVNNVNRFIYFSTFHVYGETSESIITEETLTRPVHPYAITHLAAEDFVRYFHHDHSMKTLIFRLSNGYGYPMDKGINRWTLVFNDLCKQVVTSGRIILRSSGRQYRNFISLYDITGAVCHFIFKIADKWGDGLYNLGWDCSMSILDVAQKISEIYFKKYNKKILEIATCPSHNEINEPKQFTYSIEKLKKSGFSLNGYMEQEILNTMEVCEGFTK
jgi:UDP-glucose 4-epimerase